MRDTIKERIAALERECDRQTEELDQLQRRIADFGTAADNTAVGCESLPASTGADNTTVGWTPERWAAYHAEAEAYFDALDYVFETSRYEPPRPLPGARVVRRGFRGWIADLCHRTAKRGD